jgi:hypothetical protein
LGNRLHITHHLRVKPLDGIRQLVQKGKGSQTAAHGKAPYLEEFYEQQ